MLYNCPECGGQVSDSAVSCPHCGYSLTNLKHCEECNALITENNAVCPQCGCQTPWSRKCPDCGNYVLTSEEKCPECGFDMLAYFGRVNTIFSPSNNHQSEYDTNYSWEEMDKPSRKKWFIIGGLVVVIGIALAWWFMGGRDNTTMQHDLEEKLHQATTEEEVVNLINGTTWHCTNASQLPGWLQVSFKNGHYTCYSATPSDGEWTQTGSGTYTVSEGRFANTGKKYVCIEWECDFRIIKFKDTLPCEFRFFPINGQIDVYCHYAWRLNRALRGIQFNLDEEKPASGIMHLGEYKW